MVVGFRVQALALKARGRFPGSPIWLAYGFPHDSPCRDLSCLRVLGIYFWSVLPGSMGVIGMGLFQDVYGSGPPSIMLRILTIQS